MAASQHDRTVVRELARQLAEVAADPVQAEKAELWWRLNHLARVRPLVLLQNAMWHETGSEIALECADEFA